MFSTEVLKLMQIIFAEQHEGAPPGSVTPADLRMGLAFQEKHTWLEPQSHCHLLSLLRMTVTFETCVVNQEKSNLRSQLDNQHSSMIFLQLLTSSLNIECCIIQVFPRKKGIFFHPFLKIALLTVAACLTGDFYSDYAAPGICLLAVALPRLWSFQQSFHYEVIKSRRNIAHGKYYKQTNLLTDKRVKT